MTATILDFPSSQRLGPRGGRRRASRPVVGDTVTLAGSTGPRPVGHVLDRHASGKLLVDWGTARAFHWACELDVVRPGPLRPPTR